MADSLYQMLYNEKSAKSHHKDEIGVDQLAYPYM